jgi:hypothetical protein
MPQDQRPRTIVAITGEEEHYRAVREKAGEIAATEGAGVILYNLDAADLFSSPLPTNWSGEGEEELYRHPERLGPDDLDAVGRPNIAAQVRDFRSRGIEAWAWLPDSADGEDLAAYAERQGAGLIVVPEDLASPSLIERLQGAGLDETREATNIPVMTVRTDGTEVDA